ncbi:MAG: acetate/propionate family kinase [Bryobacterales bacterium]|nr:acetate/propionate family kinase [Bryobacterales bacterium]
MRTLVFNAGSSSLKAALYEVGAGAPLKAPEAVWRENVEQEAVGELLERAGPVDCVGHRVVQGGRFLRPVVVTDEVKREIRRTAELAPEHNRTELQTIEAVESRSGSGLPQVAVFDTEFHSAMPKYAAAYPGPYSWWEQGIRRFGFHGISHEYVAGRAAELLGRRIEELRLVTCHLGGGSSLAAVRQGRSVDTTMGFTPLEGLMMGTRSGSVDPGILIHLMRNCGYGAEELDRILNKESGVAGISGLAGNMRTVEAARAEGDSRAQLAWDMYVHRLARELGGMLASAGGADAIVFTGGIGENAAAVRAGACERFRFAGVAIDAERNDSAKDDADVSADGAAVRVLVVRTREEWAIARKCHAIIAAGA